MCVCVCVYIATYTYVHRQSNISSTLTQDVIPCVDLLQLLVLNILCYMSRLCLLLKYTHTVMIVYHITIHMHIRAKHHILVVSHTCTNETPTCTNCSCAPPPFRLTLPLCRCLSSPMVRAWAMHSAFLRSSTCTQGRSCLTACA